MAKISSQAECYLCASREKLHRHHIDWNHSNNKLENLIIVCQSCHVALHKAGFLDLNELTEIRNKAVNRDSGRFASNAQGIQEKLF